VLQQHPLGAREGDDLTVLLDEAAVEVDFHISHSYGVAGAGAWGDGTPQHGANAGGQLVRVKRLHKVVVGAELEASDLVFVVVLAGQQDYGDLGALSQATHNFETRHVGHEDVEHDDIGALLFGDTQGFFAVTGDDYAKSLAGQLELDQAQDACFVVDSENKRIDCHLNTLLLRLKSITHELPQLPKRLIRSSRINVTSKSMCVYGT